MRSKCGNTASPCTSPIAGTHFGVLPVIASRTRMVNEPSIIAPALQPASAAPLCQRASSVSHAGVSCHVSIAWFGLPPEK